MSFQLRVAVRRQGRTHLELAFDRSPITVGALPHNDVVLTDPYVSGEHATVMVSRGELIYRDTSRNGSYLGGERVREVRLGASGRVDVPPFEIELTFEPGSVERLTRYRGEPADEEATPRGPIAADRPIPARTTRPSGAVVAAAVAAAEAAEAAAAVRDAPPAPPGDAEATVLADSIATVPPEVRLHVVRGCEALADRVLELPPLPDVRLGRSQAADVPVPVMTMSRLHAAVRWCDDGGVVVADLGSSNGTFVNGRRVVEPRRLEQGDELRLGELVLRVDLVPRELPGDADGDGGAHPAAAGAVPGVSAVIEVLPRLRQDEPAVVALSGTLERADRDALIAAVERALASGPRRLVFDLGGLAAVRPDAAALFAEVLELLRRGEGDLRLAGASASVREAIAGSGEVAERLSGTREEAVASWETDA